MKKYVTVLFFVLIGLKIAAQGESFGLSTSNYAGVNSIALNPSAMHNQNVWFSFTGLSGNLFLHTDYAYLDKTKFRLADLLDPNFELTSHFTGEGVGGRVFYSNLSEKNTSFDQNLRIAGPSLMMTYNHHSFALTTTARMQTNIRNLSPDLGNILYYGLDYEPQYGLGFQVDNFNVTSMAWSEIGLSYAYRFNKDSYTGWSFGISVKRLYGAGGGYFNLDHTVYAIEDDGSVAEILEQQAQIGLSAPIDFDADFSDYSVEMIRNNFQHGRGWAFDIGFTYMSLIDPYPRRDAVKFCEQPLSNYKFRIGVALLDIGSITFKENAQIHDFSNTNPVIGELTGIVLDNANQVLQMMSERYYGSPTQSLVENTLNIALPMALSAQFDYNSEIAHLYLNTSLIYGVPLQGGALRRPSQLTIAPRYETRYFEFGMPLSLYQFQYPHLGVYARVGPFTVGSDWLSSLLGTQDFNGMDFYFAAKFQLSKQSCRGRMTIQDACRY